MEMIAQVVVIIILVFCALSWYTVGWKCGDDVVVTFCGHKDIPDPKALTEKLESVLKVLIGEGADHFLLGGYGKFDMLAACVLRDLKTVYPDICSTLVLAYLNREYNESLYDDTTYPPLENVPFKYAVLRRNEWMADQADVIVAYVTHSWGGAAATLRYAERKKKRIILVNS